MDQGSALLAIVEALTAVLAAADTASEFALAAKIADALECAQALLGG